MIHICGETSESTLVKFDKSFCEENGLPIPKDTSFSDNTLTFIGEYEAKKYVRTNAELFPRFIKSIQLYSTFIDKLSNGKIKWTRPGKILRATLTLTEFRELKIEHQPKKYKRQLDEESEKYSEREDDILDDWED